MPEVEAAYAAGYAAVVLEMRPGWDVEVLRAVRRTFGSQPLGVDCDAAYTLAAQEMFYRLEDFFLDWIEQPLPPDDLVGHAMLQESLRTPICARAVRSPRSSGPSTPSTWVRAGG